VLGVANLSEDFLIKRLRKKLFPMRWLRKWPGIQWEIDVRAGAAPWPNGCFPNQAGGKRIAFDIGGGFQKSYGSFHRMRAKAVLINRTSTHIFMANAPTGGVGGSKPVHETAQNTGFRGSAE